MKKGNLSELLDMFLPTYRSIDLRTAIVKIEKKWTNVVTAIRFSHLPLTAMREHQKHIQKKRKECKTSHFKVLFKTYSVKNWKELLKDIESGQFKIGNFQISATGTENIKHTEGRRNLHLESEDGWPVLEFNPGRSGERIQMMDVLDEVLGEVRKASGHQSPVRAIKQLLSIHYEASHDLGFSIGLPFYGVLHGPYWSNGRSCCRLETHRNLSNLKLDIFVMKNHGKASVRTQEGFLVDEVESQASAPDFVVREVCHDSMGAVRSDEVQFKLYSMKLPEMYLLEAENYVYKMIEGDQPQAPLHRTVLRFCNKEKLRDMLLHPHETKARKKGPGEVFERAVSWLLSLYEHPNVRLEEFEHLKARETKASYDSVDIVSFVHYPSQRALVLVCCTIGEIKESEISRARNTARVLSEDVFKDRSEIVKIVFFTPGDAELMKETAEGVGVVIIDRPKIEELLDGLEKPDYRRFDEMLGE